VRRRFARTNAHLLRSAGHVPPRALTSANARRPTGTTSPQRAVGSDRVQAALEPAQRSEAEHSNGTCEGKSCVCIFSGGISSLGFVILSTLYLLW